MTAPRETTATQQAYILDAGDELLIEDAVLPDLLSVRLRIPEDGTVDLPLIGPIQLGGLTTEAAQEALNQEYQTYLQSPQISIQVLAQRPLRIYVKGAVRQPGVYISGQNLNPESTMPSVSGVSDLNEVVGPLYLTDALMMAGGLKADADYANIRIHRQFPQPSTLHVNLWELFRRGNAAQDIVMVERDVIEVPSASRQQLIQELDWKHISQTNVSMGVFNIDVIGSVRQPGRYPIHAKQNILAAIAKAGGFSTMANQRAVYLIRANEAGQLFKKRLNMADPQLSGRGKPEWIGLLPNDVIFVDDSKSKQALLMGRNLLDRATGSALLPLFSNFLSH